MITITNEYICKRCGYNTFHSVSFKRQFDRKSILENINFDSDYIKYKIKNKIIKPTINQNKPEIEIKCDFCDKKFKYAQSLTQHITKKECKVKKEIDNNKKLLKLVNLLNERIEQQGNEFRQQLKEQQKQLNQLIN